MKKLFLVFWVGVVLSGCVYEFDWENVLEIGYVQKGKDCIYYETYAQDKHIIENKIITNTTSVETDVNARKSIIYANTQCSKIIDYDLKHNINKVPMGSVKQCCTVQE
jgi:hypothetical protein